MIDIRKSEDRGHANHGWLDSYHTFSFADYFDPEFMQFGVLRVINQDQVEPGRGFGTHGHRDMEIVSYVLDGVLEHKDSMGTGAQMRPGEVQLMSAGTGVTHSEFNGSSDDPLHFLQMWILPKEKSTAPRYEQKAYSEEERRGKLRLVVSPDGEQGSLTINQDVKLYVSLLGPGDVAEHTLDQAQAAWVHIARGKVKLNGHELGPGDGAAITDEASLSFEGVEDAEFVLWEVPVSSVVAQ
ncbi:MAG: pirin family protein [Planctomycetota bacterium]